jgi:hypothetical protein
VVIDGVEKHVGADVESLWPAIERRVAAASEASA